MKKQAVFTVAFILLAHLLRAQSGADTIGIHKMWLGPSLTYDGEKVRSMRRLSAIMRPDAAASHTLRKAKRAYAITLSILTADLVFGVVYDIHAFSKSADSYNPNTALGIYAGGLIITYPFSISSRINWLKAIKMYNRDLQKMGCNETKPELYFSFMGSGVGLGIRF